MEQDQKYRIWRGAIGGYRVTQGGDDTGQARNRWVGWAVTKWGARYLVWRDKSQNEDKLVEVIE